MVTRHCRACALTLDVLLQRHSALGRADPRTGGNSDLRLDQVDAGDALGDGVLHLNSRIHFDEIEFAGVRILQEFHGTGRTITDGPADLEGRLAQLVALCVGEERRGCALHDLLIAPLHRTVAFI